MATTVRDISKECKLMEFDEPIDLGSDERNTEFYGLTWAELIKVSKQRKEEQEKKHDN